MFLNGDKAGKLAPIVVEMRPEQSGGRIERKSGEPVFK